MPNVTFDWANLPLGYCWTGPQQYMDDIFALLLGTMPGGGSIIIGDDLPGPDQQTDTAWFRTQSGRLEGIYLFQGVWHRPHPIEPSSDEVIIWKGTEADLWLKDGGDGTDPVSNPPTDFTGAMWQVDTDFEFRFPLGIGKGNIGTNPVAYSPDAATVVAQGETGGAEKVLLDSTNTGLDTHSHLLGKMRSDSSAQADNAAFLTGTSAGNSGPARVVRGVGSGIINTDLVDETGEKLVTADGERAVDADPLVAHENLPPFRCVVFARRTARKYITALV